MATIIYEDLVTKKDINPFIVTDKTFNPLYILALINSKLLSYIYINFSSIATKDDYRQTTLSEIRDLLIKIVDITTQEEIGNKAKTIMSSLNTFEEVKNKAIDLIRSVYNLSKLTNKINEFYKYPLQTLY